MAMATSTGVASLNALAAAHLRETRYLMEEGGAAEADATSRPNREWRPKNRLADFEFSSSSTTSTLHLQPSFKRPLALLRNLSQHLLGLPCAA